MVTIGNQKIHAITDDLPNPPPTENFVGMPAAGHAGRGRRDAQQGSGHGVEVEGLATLCETRGCGVAPMAPEAAPATVDPLIRAAAWGLFDRGEAKVSPDTPHPAPRRQVAGRRALP